MTIFIDKEYRCHTSDPEGLYTNLETSAFDGKCQTYTEGYRFVPAGAVWTREDGTQFPGEMVAPWRDWQELDAAQREYERQRVSDLESENETLLNDMAQMVDEVYASDMEMMGL